MPSVAKARALIGWVITASSQAEKKRSTADFGSTPNFLPAIGLGDFRLDSDYFAKGP